MTRRLITLFLLVSSFCVSVHAETIAMTRKTVYGDQNGITSNYDSMVAVCSKLSTLYGESMAVTPNGLFSSGNSCKSTHFEIGIVTGSINACPSGYTPVDGSCYRPDCPSGQERLIDGTCAVPCQSGFDRNASGQCVKNCTGKQGQATTNGVYEFSGAVSEWSVGQCKVSCPKRVLAAGGGIGYDCKFTGATASTDQPEAVAKKPDPVDLPPEKPLDCASKGMGYVQSSTGAVTCVASESAPPGQKPTVQEDKPKVSGTPGPDGKPDPTSPDYEKKVTENSTTGGETTSKETSTKNPVTGTDGSKTCPTGYTMSADQTACTKVTTTTQPTSDFCKDNPTAAACKGSAPDSCTDNPNRASCKDLGEAPSEGAVDEKAVGVNSISIIPVAMANSCPTGDALPRGLGNYNFQPMCDFAGAMKPIILAFAWIAAFLIVIGVSRD